MHKLYTMQISDDLESSLLVLFPIFALQLVFL